MRNSSILSALLFLSAAFVSGCKKDDPGISNVPEITSVTLSPAAATAFADSLTFTIGYRDGDGDLGENGTDVKNLFISDPRISAEYEYRIPQLAPTGSGIAITGNVVVKMLCPGITDGSASQSVTFSVRMKDRSGNNSNTYACPALTIQQ